jgi:hypothetical protein
MKLKMTVELEYDESTCHGDDDGAIEVFLTDTLGPQGDLSLYCNSSGTAIGSIRVVDIENPFSAGSAEK